MSRIDIVIIGGGAGGYASAIKATRLGLKAVLVEKDKLGGVCLNKGCIPTKALLATVERLHYIQKAREFGIQVKDYSFDFPAIMERKDRIIRRLSSDLLQLMQINKIRVVRGEAQIIEPGEVEVLFAEGQREVIFTKNIIIATGSKAMRLPIPGINSEGIITSEQALSLKELPSKIIIIGGGVIGIEFANIFNALGVEVTLLEMLPRILLSVDEEIAFRLAQLLRRRGIEIITDCNIEVMKETDQRLEVLISTIKEERILESEKVLLATGRIPDMGNLNIKKLGIELESSY